jgi:DNA-binding MarR family transcriptional regulator
VTDDLHPLARLDETVHQRARLGILAVLVERTDADFAYLRRALGLTDGNLGRHLEVLVGSGLVTLRRGYDGRRQRTWARITPAGRQSLLAEVELLRSIAALAAVAGESSRPDADA